ncbi:hypothetical protein V6N13_074600 [Hibiscus sabdariffa]
MLLRVTRAQTGNLDLEFLTEIVRVQLHGSNGSNPAHALAAEGLRLSIDRSWVEDAHDLVWNLAAHDCWFIEPP